MNVNDNRKIPEKKSPIQDNDLEPVRTNANMKSDFSKNLYPNNRDNKIMNLNQKISLNFNKAKRNEDN